MTTTESGEKCLSSENFKELPLFLQGRALETSKTLVMYNYFESAKAKRNLAFFLDHGVHERPDTDFLIVSNSHICLDLPLSSNFGIVFRENTCYDLGAHKETILRYDLKKRYSKFILLNGSVRGPFMPNWSQDCWTDAFTRHLNFTVKLVGPTFNCEYKDEKYPHLQSMILATDRIGLGLLLENYKCFTSKRQAIELAEITNYKTIKDAGYDVHVFFDQFQLDRLDIDHCSHGVPRKIHPLEVIFIKTSPTILPDLVAAYTEYMDESQYNSRDVCK